MTLPITFMTATSSIVEVDFTDRHGDIEMKDHSVYNGRRVKLSALKSVVIEKAIRQQIDIEERFADAKFAY
jgi:hypothetical protein